MGWQSQSGRTTLMIFHVGALDAGSLFPTGRTRPHLRRGRICPLLSRRARRPRHASAFYTGLPDLSILTMILFSGGKPVSRSWAYHDTPGPLMVLFIDEHKLDVTVRWEAASPVPPPPSPPTLCSRVHGRINRARCCSLRSKLRSPGGSPTPCAMTEAGAHLMTPRGTQPCFLAFDLRRDPASRCASGVWLSSALSSPLLSARAGGTGPAPFPHHFLMPWSEIALEVGT
jgi:hypothetical protein